MIWNPNPRKYTLNRSSEIERAEAGVSIAVNLIDLQARRFFKAQILNDKGDVVAEIKEPYIAEQDAYQAANDLIFDRIVIGTTSLRVNIVTVYDMEGL